jgi:hypothetical protein
VLPSNAFNDFYNRADVYFEFARKSGGRVWMRSTLLAASKARSNLENFFIGELGEGVIFTLRVRKRGSFVCHV